MRLIILVFFNLFCSAVFCQTQAEMNQQAHDDYKKADKELNKIYTKLLYEYKEDTVFIKNLKVAQNIWIKFRDAELKMKYPEREPGWYGSVHPMCVARYLEELTIERIMTLKEWVNGFEEGDSCGGSLKMRKSKR